MTHLGYRRFGFISLRTNSRQAKMSLTQRSHQEALPRTLSLTPDLIALVDRIVPEVGREPGLKLLEGDGYRRLAGAIMQEANGPLHIFAYGSLIWKPQTGFTTLG